MTANLQWEEVAPPAGLELATLGQTPREHGGRFYVKHPHTGRVLGYGGGGHFGTPQPTTTVNIDPVAAAVADVAALQAAITASVGSAPVQSSLLTALALIATDITNIQAYVANLKAQLAAQAPPNAIQQPPAGGGSGGGTVTQQPAAPGATTTPMSATTGGLIGAGAGGVVGFAVGFLAGRSGHAAAPAGGAK
jgi:hypothetical protein